MKGQNNDSKSRRFTLEERPDWRWWVTPKPLYDRPIHRWHVFPHSFSSELVKTLIDEWRLKPQDLILDPFVGAGTTLLAAKEKQIPAVGYDLSPLSVFVARTKLANYKLPDLEGIWRRLKKSIESAKWNGTQRSYPDLVRRALPGGLLAAFDGTDRLIDSLTCSRRQKDFFRLVLIAIIPDFSRAVATGGWLKWRDHGPNVRSFARQFTNRVESMLTDVCKNGWPRGAHWQVIRADARRLPDCDNTYTAVITSPPYPNRHDYTRVFGVELMFGFLNWAQTRDLRYQSFHSHPEAHPDRPGLDGYEQPISLKRAIGKIRSNGADERVSEMLSSYFLDMYLSLREVERVCKPGARIAFVVGNAQYSGVRIEVDKLTAEVGEHAGLKCEKLVVARYRGNSAQQMGRFGRRLSRESVVVFTKP